MPRVETRDVGDDGNVHIWVADTPGDGVMEEWATPNGALASKHHGHPYQP